MNVQILVGLTSSVLGGIMVALITYLSTRKRTAAEVRKLDAEAERTKTETTKMLIEMQAHQTTRAPGSAVPPGWFIAGSEPDDYDFGTDTSVAYSGARSGFIAARAEPRGFGTLMQTFKADRFRGERLMLSAFIKTVDVERPAGLWMRVDGPDGTTLAFDNMDSRPILGTRDWRQYRVVLDVPKSSNAIAFGILLAGNGQVWLDDVAFNPVSHDTPITGTDLDALPSAPMNLDFNLPGESPGSA
jgi:hypothetical protein